MYSRPRRLWTVTTVDTVTAVVARAAWTRTEARKSRWPASAPSSASSSVRSRTAKADASPRSTPISGASRLRSRSSRRTQPGTSVKAASSHSSGSVLTPAGTTMRCASAKSRRGSAAWIRAARGGTGTSRGRRAETARSRITHGPGRCGAVQDPVATRSALSSSCSSTQSCSQRIASGHTRHIGPRSVPSMVCRTRHDRPSRSRSSKRWYPSTPTCGTNRNSTHRPGSCRTTV